jgi:acyl-CoA thioester hydrolase
MDMRQHVNNASYVVWIETSRCLYCDEVLDQPISGQSGVILARLEIDYELPLDYREEVAVTGRISRIGRKSFDFEHEIWSETRNKRAAHAVASMVAYDHSTKSSIVFPQQWRDIVAGYELIAPIVG